MIDFSADHFSLFSLPRRFRIDGAALDHAYRSLQAEVHPDRHAETGSGALRAAMQASARVNEAYGTLRNPASRGEYLLGLEGVISLAATDTAMPADFLLAQMERREAIEAAQHAGDPLVLERVLAEIIDEHAALEHELAAALDDRGDLAAARAAVRKLRFLDRLREEVTDALLEAEH
jgi:molecular chaperone HscB